MSGPAAETTALHPARMGLEPLPLAAWLKPAAGDDAILAERARLIAADAADVIAARPEAYAAIAELAALLRERGFKLADTDSPLDTLGDIGRAVAEDLCILTEPGDGGYRLTAGILCFPNRWRLKEKIGGNVLAVHGPVPDYHGELSDAVDRFLTRLKPERAYLRRNWGLAGSPDLYLPQPIPAVDPNAAAGVFLRREDQGFLKLAKTSSVIFSIRTTVTPWQETPGDLRAGILKTIAGLSPAWLDYKSIG